MKFLKIGDYVEGCEWYGSSIAYIRGWISDIKLENNTIKHCDIKCDDSYNGTRGNALIIDSNYPIRKIEQITDWFKVVDRFYLGRTYFYRVGLDKQFLIDKSVIRFWDIDGVLSTFAYGGNGVNVCEDKYFQEYMKNHNPYMDALAPSFLINFLYDNTNIENNYVVSRKYSDIELEQKLDFINMNYKNRILAENVFFVDSLDKSTVIKEILNTKYNGLDTRHCLIDDNINVLSLAQSNGITTIHISSLLNLI